jgi:hypothetical protein
VLAQDVPVRENSKYVLSYRYRTSEIAPGTGLAWRIADTKHATTLAEGPDLSADEETQNRISFATPAGCRLVRLSLDYRRSLGTTRITGYVVLRSIQMELGN